MAAVACHADSLASCSSSSSSHAAHAAEVILLTNQEFTRDNCLVINGMSPQTSHEKLLALLSECGMLTQLQLHESSDGRHYAYAQFFSRSECSNCLQELDGCTLDARRLNMRRLSRSSQRKLRIQGQPLKVSQAVNAANHFLGSTGWSHSVETLECKTFNAPVPPALQAEAEYRATVSVCGAGFHLSAAANGSASAEDADMVKVRGRARKTAISNALRTALSRLAIVRLSSGKTHVQILNA